jgi:hypothetical protein
LGKNNALPVGKDLYSLTLRGRSGEMIFGLVKHEALANARAF